MAAGDVPDTIFAERTTWTGSIGVIIPHFTVADLLESWKIQDDSVVSGPYKELGSPTQKLSPEMAKKERAILQGLVDQTFDQFKEVVAEARPQLANNKEAFATATTGQVFTAKQALDLGLVDKLGFLEDAVDRAIELAKLDPHNVPRGEIRPPGRGLECGPVWAQFERLVAARILECVGAGRLGHTARLSIVHVAAGAGKQSNALRLCGLAGDWGMGFAHLHFDKLRESGLQCAIGGRCG